MKHESPLSWMMAIAIALSLDTWEGAAAPSSSLNCLPKWKGYVKKNGKKEGLPDFAF